MPALSEVRIPFAQQQRLMSDKPWDGIEEDYNRIYVQGIVEIGVPEGLKKTINDAVRPNTTAISGAMYGDEGKGRIVDNQISTISKVKGITKIVVDRYNGGNNAGHTLERADGTRIALHVIPSGILYEQATGIIDKGVVVHPEDLQTEFEYAEGYVGDLRGKVFVSNQAIFGHDLERAEEELNKYLSGGKSEGGTGRGISSAYANQLNRRGLRIKDFLKDDWEEVMAKKYDDYQKEFSAHGLKLEEIKVPDFRAAKLHNKEGEEAKRTVGTKAEFMDRLKNARDWFLDRNMNIDTLEFHRENFYDPKTGIIFEGAQGIGISALVGSYPDVTASDTSVYGILAGTQYYKPENIEEKLGICKITYTSSVGARTLPTEIDLSSEHNMMPANPTHVQIRGKNIRDAAHEQGTTTKRWRDVAELDLACLSFNGVLGGIDALAGTMLDIAWEGETIRVATHYLRNGRVSAFRPGLEEMGQLTPVYIDLPSWDGIAASKAKNFNELPINAQKMLSFIEARTGFPIIAATMGASRDKIMHFQNYTR